LHYIFHNIDLNIVGFIMELAALQYQAKPAPTPKQTAHDEAFWGRDGFNFADVLDMVNPLHHLPIVSTFYRNISGDECSEGAKIIGDVGFGVLTGGVFGVAGAAANTAIRHETNKNISDHIIDLANAPAQATASVETVNKLTEKENLFFAQNMGDDFNTGFIAAVKKVSGLSNKNISKPEEDNLFFAQLFDSDSQYSSTQLSQAIIQEKRQEKKSGKDWGSV
jgi:hypothetical protein